MELHCKISTTASDVRCPVCGQGTLIYRGSLTAVIHRTDRKLVASALRQQHEVGGHTLSAFTLAVPESEALPCAA